MKMRNDNARNDNDKKRIRKHLMTCALFIVFATQVSISSAFAGKPDHSTKRELPDIVKLTPDTGSLLPDTGSLLPDTAYSDDYILEDSNSRYLQEPDYYWMDSTWAQLAINEIYARHGRIFKDKTLNDWFSSKSWYRGTVDASHFDENVFNAYEKENIRRLRAYQDSLNASSSGSNSGSGSKSNSGSGNGQRGSSDYILKDSSTKYLQESDYNWMDADWTRLAINEIYARHGRKFSDKTLNDYFSSKSWYRGTVDASRFDEKVFNTYEEENIKRLRAYQNSLSSRSSGSSHNSSGSAQRSSSDYILKDSSTKYLQESDYNWMDADWTRLAINEIYARHGRKFTDKTLNDYFSSKSWYRGTVDASHFDERVFNTYEEENIKRLRAYQNSLSSRGSGSNSSRNNSGSAQRSSSDYILKDSSTKYLQESDYNWMDYDWTRLAINEIYARHGRKFTDKTLNDYFSSKSWYRGTVDASHFDEKVFNAYEKENIVRLRAWQNKVRR